MVKNLCIIQARLTSSRLPNKVLNTLGNSGRSMLEHVYERLMESKHIDKVVFAIPESASNDELAFFLDSKSLEYVRGSEDNVLDRFYKCASVYRPEYIIRSTCDNPFVDWALADYLIEQIGDNDLIGCKETPLGTSVSVFSMKSLESAYQNVTSVPEKEHVTPYILNHMNVKFIHYNDYKFRLTVDEEKDFYLVNTLYEHLYQGTPIPNTVIYQYLETHPDLANYNTDVHQKQVGE